MVSCIHDLQSLTVLFSHFQHHCRNCGDIFCDKCTSGRIALTADEQAQPVRVCDRCLVCPLLHSLCDLRFLYLRY